MFNFKHQVAYTDKAPTSAKVQRDTLADAKQRIAAQLQMQKLYAADQSNPKPSSLNTKPSSNGRVCFGIKYGNRYLKSVFQDEETDPRTSFLLVHADDLQYCYDLAVKLVDDGVCDAAIEAAMQANIALHAK